MIIVVSLNSILQRQSNYSDKSGVIGLPQHVATVDVMCNEYRIVINLKPKRFGSTLITSTNYNGDQGVHVHVCR